jgi:hypothetical protein
LKIQPLNKKEKIINIYNHDPAKGMIMKRNITPYRKLKAYCNNKQVVAIVVFLFLFSSFQNCQAQNGSAKPVSVKPGTASVGDYVWIDNNNNGIQDPGEPGVPNILVVLYDSLLNKLASKYTDATGHYTFDNISVPLSGEQSFIIGFYNVPPDYAYTSQVTDSNFKNVNSKLDPITGRTMPFRLHSGSSITDIDAGIKSAPGVVLPLTIDQFNGNYNNGVIQLKWTTFTETDIDHFDIERSTDGTNFRQIGTLSATGGSSTNTPYSFMDLTADKGSSFYRLAMIDNDGNYTYSKAITVSVDVKGISVSVVYPNPFSKRVQVRINCEKPEQITIRVMDNAGVVVKTQLANVQPGENNIVIQNVAELPGGIYFLEVTGDHRSMKTKLMKQ